MKTPDRVIFILFGRRQSGTRVVGHCECICCYCTIPRICVSQWRSISDVRDPCAQVRVGLGMIVQTPGRIWLKEGVMCENMEMESAHTNVYATPSWQDEPPRSGAYISSSTAFTNIPRISVKSYFIAPKAPITDFISDTLNTLSFSFAGFR